MNGEDRSPMPHSSITPVDRAHRGKARIKARLIGDYDPDEWDLPPKPKWMRWWTYNTLKQEFDAYEALLDRSAFARVIRLISQG